MYREGGHIIKLGGDKRNKKDDLSKGEAASYLSWEV